MNINMQDINKRIYALNHNNCNLKTNVILYNDRHVFLKENALECIKNWSGLDENSNLAFNKALDIFSEICMNCDDNDIKKAYNYLSEGIVKVRDHNSLANVIKTRNSRIKTKISTKINKKQHDEINQAIQSTIDDLTSKLSSKGVAPTTTSESTIQLIDKCFKLLEEKSNEIKQCDVIINNYNKISKRYNLDRIISEVCYDNDIYQCINELVSCIDTYNIPFISKYNAALETSYYLLNKHFMNYPSDKIIEAVTDYFIFNHNNSSMIEDIKFIKEHSIVFDENDFSSINYLFENEDNINNNKSIELEDALDNVDSYGVDIETLNEGHLEDAKNKAKEWVAGNPDERKDNDVKELISDFRKQCANDDNKDSSSKLMMLKALINKIFTKSPSQIVLELPNMFGIIRASFIITATAINPILGVVSLIGSKILKITLDRKQVEKVITAYSNEIKSVKNKLEKTKDNDRKEKLQKYLNELNKDLEKIKEYRNNLYTDEENDERDMYDFDDDFDFEYDDDSEFNESQLIQLSSVIAIGDLVSSVYESLANNKISDIINENVSRFDDNLIDNITDLSIMAPNVVKKDKLCESFYNEVCNIRSKDNLYADDYIKIDCLNNNIYKLKESNNTFTLSTNPKNIMCYLSCLNEIASIPQNDYLLEMNFTNTIKLAINNLKRDVIKLSDKEKKLSNTLDVSMNNISKGIEDSLTNDNREAIIRGRILPSASKTIKIALMTGAVWAVSPATAVIGAIGAFACSSKLKAKERQIVLDDIEIELKMCERYLRQAEEKNDMKAIRQIEVTQRNLERQQQRIKYKMNVIYNQKTDVKKFDD